MMIVDEDASVFAVSETHGGKLIRLAFPAAKENEVASNYDATGCHASVR